MAARNPAMSGFRDHFSGSASSYARFRPTYPAELFRFLAALTSAHELAWDCGTGSGQAAIQLTEHYERVIGTDGSAEQISLAPPHPRVEYRCESADRASLASGSADLVTVAAALHWFDLDSFYPEVNRVLKPGGVIAAWAYHLPSVSPAVDAIVADYSSRLLAADWPAGSSHVQSRYRSLPFPFLEIPVPDVDIELFWTVGELAGFIGSWSAAIAYRKRTGSNPVDAIVGELQQAYGSGTRLVRCPLFLRVGRSSLAG